jgi:ADP-heptose:LPS heptosyltransferase
MAENILLIRLKSIGDVILTLPAVNVIRQNFPQAKITFLTSHENAALIRGFAAVDNVIALDRAALKKPRQTIPEAFRLLRQLRAGNFSRVVDFQGYGETAWLTRLTGATDRWGGVYKKSRSWAYTKAIERPQQIHPAAGHLQLLADCGLKSSTVKNDFQLPAEALAAAEDFFRAQKMSIAKPTLFLQPFTSSPHKNWPLENFLALARHFQGQGVQIIFGGGPADRARLAAAESEGFAISAGAPMLVTGGLMQLAALTVGGDTGALHLAVAQGKRVLMLLHHLHPGSPVPFQHPDWILAPAANGSIADISTNQVIAACERAFSGPIGSVSY